MPHARRRGARRRCLSRDSVIERVHEIFLQYLFEDLSRENHEEEIGHRAQQHESKSSKVYDMHEMHSRVASNDELWPSLEPLVRQTDRSKTRAP